MEVIIENISERQIIAFIRLFGYMQACGSVGTSRNIVCDVDGDGAFRPNFIINGTQLNLPKVKSKYGEYEVLDEDKTINLKTIYFE